MQIYHRMSDLILTSKQISISGHENNQQGFMQYIYELLQIDLQVL